MNRNTRLYVYIYTRMMERAFSDMPNFLSIGKLIWRRKETFRIATFSLEYIYMYVSMYLMMWIYTNMYHRARVNIFVCTHSQFSSGQIRKFSFICFFAIYKYVLYLMSCLCILNDWEESKSMGCQRKLFRFEQNKRNIGRSIFIYVCVV